MSRACRRDEPESTARQICRGKRPNRLIRGGKVKFSDGGETVSRSLRAVAGAAVQVSREYQEALRGRAYCGRICGADYANAGVGVGVAGKGALPTFQRWGAVGVLTISVVSSQVELAFGGRDAGCGLLSAEAWTWLRDFFRSPEICLQVRYALPRLSCPTARFYYSPPRRYRFIGRHPCSHPLRECITHLGFGFAVIMAFLALCLRAIPPNNRNPTSKTATTAPAERRQSDRVRFRNIRSTS